MAKYRNNGSVLFPACGLFTNVQPLLPEHIRQMSRYIDFLPDCKASPPACGHITPKAGFKVHLMSLNSILKPEVVGPLRLELQWSFVYCWSYILKVKPAIGEIHFVGLYMFKAVKLVTTHKVFLRHALMNIFTLFFLAKTLKIFIEEEIRDYREKTKLWSRLTIYGNVPKWMQDMTWRLSKANQDTKQSAL